MARAHKLSFVELQTFEEWGISLHESAWLLFQGHGLWPSTGSTHNPRESSSISQRNWLNGKRDPGHNSGFINSNINLSTWERFVRRLKIPQTVLPFPSHKFTSPRTAVRTSGDKKGQSYFLIWSSLLYGPSGLRGRSGFIPREESLGTSWTAF